MKPKEIKTKLAELGYDENKYFEIRDFMHANGENLKCIKDITANDWCSVHLIVGDDFITTILEV